MPSARRRLPSGLPSTMAANSFGTPWMITMNTCTTMNAANAHMPRKCRLRAPCLPPNSLPYQGNRASTDGDIAAPVAICSGESRKITTK